MGMICEAFKRLPYLGKSWKTSHKTCHEQSGAPSGEPARILFPRWDPRPSAAFGERCPPEFKD
jgi:hypothetical protein